MCTNGVPLNRPAIRAMLIDTGVRGVSVSLDSADPVLNDLHRPAHNRADGWSTVVAGIRALLADRSGQPDGSALPKVGLYSVITRRTLAGVPETARFAAGLGLDYFVPQPIALERGHRLYDELVLRHEDVDHLTRVLDQIYDADLGMELPGRGYPERVVSTVRSERQLVRGCFGGHRLAFIQPDGTVWDCPSSHKIASIARAGLRRSIASHTATELFPAQAATGGCDCPLFSGDCVNMLPLMDDFDRFLTATGGAR